MEFLIELKWVQIVVMIQKICVCLEKATWMGNVSCYPMNVIFHYPMAK